jgi:hypothetical protein
MTTQNTPVSTIEWRPIAGFEARYEVSSDGKVRSLNFGGTKKVRELAPIPTEGYMRVFLNNGTASTRVRRYIHHVVAEAFLLKPAGNVEINHIDGDKGNNSVSNLEWVTKSENLFHRYRVLCIGYPSGAKSRLAKKVLVRFPGGEVKEVHGIRAFCREQGLSPSSLRESLCGSEHRGFKLIQAQDAAPVAEKQAMRDAFEARFPKSAEFLRTDDGYVEKRLSAWSARDYNTQYSRWKAAWQASAAFGRPPAGVQGDAARYQWLREQSHPWGSRWLSREVLDAAIDRAIAAQSTKGA